MNVAEKVDIIILNYNNNGFIQECIKSVEENTEGYNLIVVDQNSKDGSREWLIENKPSHLILNKKNVGISKGRNQGIRAGKYPWIVFIDSDIIIRDKNWLDKMWNYTIDSRIGYIECRVETPEGVQFSGDCFCMVRRQCLNEIGYYDEHFIIAQDLDFWARLQWHKFWKTAWCYDTDIFHLNHTTMLGAFGEDWKDFQKEMYALIEKKYTKEFLELTMWENHKERDRKTKELLNGETSILSSKD